MRLVRVEIQPNWERIKSYVEGLVSGTHSIVEDVYAACKYGHAHLFMSEDGFVILQEQIHPMDKEKELLVWLGQMFDNRNMFISYESEIREIAKEIGVKRVVFFTTRSGFARVLPEGWKIRNTT